MHPILYPPGEKDFLDNGLAVLTDCTKCLVTEERNGAYTLEMQYPANGRHYDLIAEDCILLAKPNPDDEPQPFRIYKSGVTMSGVTTWYGEHVSYFANDVPIEPIATSQTTPAGAFAKISAAAALENPFTFSTTLSTETSFGLATPTPLKKVLGGVDGSVLDQFGGEYHYNKWKIELLKSRGADRGFVISYGKNLTDITQEKNLTKVTTAIFPFWKSSGDDDTLVTLPEKIVVLDGAREYGHVHCKAIDFSQDFTDAPSVDTLRAYAKAYLKTSGIAEPVVSITLKYAQLVKRKQGAIIAGLASASLCDTVSVEFPRYGISVKAKIVKVIYNTLKERYEEAEIGEAKSRLSQTVNNSRVDPDEIVKKATTDSKKTAADLIDAASKEIVESITGSNGGYVVQRPAKNPQETLYMDTPDVTTARNVMRLNKDGIAFSTNGVGGPYSGALAINGKWFSQFIATWELTANIIKAGILQDAVGKNSINLDTGEVNLDCKSLKIQGKTTEEIAAGKASEAETAAKKAAADELNAYKEAVTKDLADMQDQIDGQIETWFYDAEPSPTTPPASDWTTDELKENHAGDLYYSGKGYAYRWTYSGGAWTWLQIKDTDITAALQNAKKAQETANSKRRTFLVRPTPPYDVGDLWANGTDLLACVTARGEGASYSANDWETKTDYTTKKTAQLIVDASIEKIELGIAEDVSATDFFSTAAWKAESGSYTATSGSVTIAGDTATVVAPDSTETGKRRAVVIDVPTAMLAAAQGKRVTLSMRYKVNSEISGNAVIVLWANYESGNESRRLMTLATTSQTTPAGDWTTATLNYTFKDEKPTRVYLFAYLYAGTGSLSVELPTMSEATGKKSTISLTKDGTTISSFALDLSKYATGTELKVGLDEISASVVKNGEIRSKFALDSSSCTISAGTIKFTGNTLVVESTNFNLNADGTVSITGAFYSNGSSGNATIRDGNIHLSALNADGNRYNTISLSYTAKAYPSGSITVYSRRANGTVGDGVVIQGGDADSRIWIYNAYGNCDVLLQSGTGNNCEFAGGINVKGENGVNVSRAVSARDLKWWGDLTATGEQTRIKPRSRQNALYTDWQYWKSVDGVSYWVLTGKGTPW